MITVFTTRQVLASRQRVLAGIMSMIIIGMQAAPGSAAEIEIKAQANCSSVIRLGDIAEVFGASEAEIARLKGVELGPAPRPGTSQWLSIREIQDALWKRNIDYVSHNIVGARRVEVKNVAEPDAAQLQNAAGAFGANPSEVSTTLAQQVRTFLRDRIDANTDWRVRVNLTQGEAEQFRRQLEWEIAGVPRRPVAGDVQGWLGTHQIAFEPRSFVRQAATGAAPERLSIAIEVTLPPTIVALRYDVRAGTVLTPNHLQIQAMPVEDEQRGIEPLTLQDTVGKELTRTLYAGQVLSSTMLRSPQLVKKSDAVTVIVDNGTVRLRAVGIALANGSLGELIDVQSEFQKDHFPAKVVGPATVEVKLGIANQPASNMGNVAAAGRSSNTNFDQARLFQTASLRGATSHRTGGANQPTSLPARNASNRSQSARSNSPVRLKW